MSLPSRKEQNMSDTAAELISNITIHAIYDDEVELPVYGNLVKLRGLHKLRFRLEFKDTLEDTRFWVTVVIRRRGRTAMSNTTDNNRPNEFRLSRYATSFRRMYDVQGDPPWLEFEVEDNEPEQYHDGPGPYETAIALTPPDENGEPDEQRDSSLSYDFTGVTDF
jgi:hypothetical protein